ncbi:MAG: hypothetical protein Q8Q12_09380 [bacterium]|nr:hypothetical protein [bacterium]
MTSDPTPRPDPRPMLVGWDDGKIYLYIAGKEYCISDDPELVQKILDLCRQHFERKANGESPCSLPPSFS